MCSAWRRPRPDARGRGERVGCGRAGRRLLRVPLPAAVASLTRRTESAFRLAPARPAGSCSGASPRQRVREGGARRPRSHLGPIRPCRAWHASRPRLYGAREDEVSVEQLAVRGRWQQRCRDHGPLRDLVEGGALAAGRCRPGPNGPLRPARGLPVGDEARQAPGAGRRYVGESFAAHLQTELETSYHPQPLARISSLWYRRLGLNMKQSDGLSESGENAWGGRDEHQSSESSGCGRISP